MFENLNRGLTGKMGTREGEAPEVPHTEEAGEISPEEVQAVREHLTKYFRLSEGATWSEIKAAHEVSGSDTQASVSNREEEVLLAMSHAERLKMH